MSNDFILLAVGAAAIVYLLIKIISNVRRPENFPPGPVFWPLIGNGWELRKAARTLGGQHKVFENWSQYYRSNVLGLKLGKDLVVVARSYNVVREVHLQEVYEGRPDTFFFKLRTMGTRRGITGTDGPLWYEQRMLAMRHMRSIGYGRNLMGEHIGREVQCLIEYLEELKGEKIVPSHFLTESIINILWTMVAGKRFSRHDQQLSTLLDLMRRRSKIFDMSGGLLSQYPWLRFIAPDRTGYNLIRQLNNELHEFCLTAINDHRQTLNATNAGDDFIYAFLKEMTVNQDECNCEEDTIKKRPDKTRKMIENFYNDTQLTMTMLDFFIAGSSTTSVTMEIAFMILALHPEFQERIYKEILNCQQEHRGNLDKKKNYKANMSMNNNANENNNGNNNMMSNNENDNSSSTIIKMKIPYIDAFIMEVQRLYLVTPITGPRRTLRTTVLDGYTIPKDTIVLISLYSVAMDVEHWKDPECFRPERFLDEAGQIITNDPYFMPFGQGRRRCLGDTLARACLYAFISRIVEHFHIQLTDNVEEQPCLEFRTGITISPSKPYKIRFLKRSTTHKDE